MRRERLRKRGSGIIFKAKERSLKLIHLSDLHLGKKVNRLSMQKDQEHLLMGQVLDILDEEKPDGLIIAGDIYDSTNATKDAMDLMSRFLTEVSERKIPVFIVSGNHDSEVFVSFGESFFERGGVYISPQFNGKLKSVTLRDKHGEVVITLMPYLSPALVRRHFSGETVESYTDAVRVTLEHNSVDRSKRNVLVAHQFITNSEKGGSETVSVGGSDNVEAWVFKDFDYVALGHIHKPQYVGRKPGDPGTGPVIRYSGSLLKYSFSEAGGAKSATVAELDAKGDVAVRLIPLRPMIDMAEIRGSFDEVTARSFYEGKAFKDMYLRITLTDDNETEGLRDRLLRIYPNLMAIDFDNRRTREDLQLEALESLKRLSPLELVETFFERQQGKKLTDEQREYARKLLEELEEGR